MKFSKMTGKNGFNCIVTPDELDEYNVCKEDFSIGKPTDSMQALFARVMETARTNDYIQVEVLDHVAMNTSFMADGSLVIKATVMNNNPVRQLLDILGALETNGEELTDADNDMVQDICGKIARRIHHDLSANAIEDEGYIDEDEDYGDNEEDFDLGMTYLGETFGSPMYDEEESEQENEEECNGNCEHCHAYKDNDLIEARCENFSGVMNTVHLLNRYDVDGDLYEENGEYSIIFSATGTKLKSLVIESCEFMINIERVDSIRMAHLEESKKLLLSNCAATLLKAENKVNNR